MAEADYHIEAAAHRALGPTLRLRLADGLPVLTLVPAEARSLGRALRAVCSGASRERELFLSPMASNHWLVTRVGDDGLQFEVAGRDCTLGRAQVVSLAEGLLGAVAALEAPGCATADRPAPG